MATANKTGTRKSATPDKAPTKKTAKTDAAKAVKTSVAAKPAATKKPAAAKAKPAAKSTARQPVTPDQRRYYIEVAAYYMAERRGFAGGNPADDWAAAEAEIDRLLAEGRLNP
jgi:surface antigen